MAYIGRGTGDISNASVLDVITFTDSVGPYNLTQDSAAFVPVSEAALIISVDGVIQSPATFSIDGSTIPLQVQCLLHRQMILLFTMVLD